MLYQALPVRECRSGAEVRETYREARGRLVAEGKCISSEIAPQPVMRARAAPEAPKRNVFASVVTLQEVERPKVTAQQILYAVARAHDVTLADLKGPIRWHRLSHARHHAVAILTQHRPDLSLPMIGQLLNRDHTTIINSRRMWPRLAARYVRQAREIEFSTGLHTHGCG